MSIKNDFFNKNLKTVPCGFCDQGMMTEITPVHSYDFNKEGYVPRSCDGCGVCSDIEEIIPETNIVLTRFSNHFIKQVLKMICNRGKTFSYSVYKNVKNRLTDRNISDPYNLADLIILELKDFNVSIDWNYVIFCIYNKFDRNLSSNNYT